MVDGWGVLECWKRTNSRPAYLGGIEDESADVSVGLLLYLVGGLGGRYAGNDYVSLAFKLEDERQARGHVSSENDCGGT